MRSITFALLASASVAAMMPQAMAQDAPKIDTVPLPANPSQIATVQCSETQRPLIVGVVGHPTTFTFPKSEWIFRVDQSASLKDGNIGEGDWQSSDKGQTEKGGSTQPMGNNISLWPVSAGENTMTIITKTTQQDGVERVCPLRLFALSDNQTSLHDPRVMFNVLIGGPGHASSSTQPAIQSEVHSTVTPQAIAAWRAKRAETKRAREQAILANAFNGSGGCHYHAKGKMPNGITPLCPMDNGQWTLMRFPWLSQKPAVYIPAPDDTKCEKEDLPRQHGSGEFVVVETIAPRFCLRLGQQVLSVINDAYNPVGRDPNTGTIDPGTHREIIHQVVADR